MSLRLITLRVSVGVALAALVFIFYMLHGSHAGASNFCLFNIHSTYTCFSSDGL